MKVLTIGRSSNNNVVLTDSKASRVHCQIIQFDNGTFAIVDFNSTNGTFVNGVRINGQVALKPGDRVQVASTDIAWQQYFPATSKKSGSSPWVWISVAAGAVATVALVVFLILHFSVGKPVDKMFAGNYPPAAMVMYEEDGVAYSVEAVQGQVVVMFEENVSHRDAIRAIRKAGGKVVAQMPDLHYYLVDAGAGKENAFIQKMNYTALAKLMFPNAVSRPCSPTPYVMDLFYEKRDKVPHGRIVAYAMRECGHGIKTVPYEEGNKGNDFINSEILTDLREIVSNTTDDESAIINMSFGFDIDAEYWIHASNNSQRSYRHSVIAEMKEFLSIVKNYDDKDFVVIKAAGNEGIKDFGTEVMDSLWYYLNDEERDIMNRHFIFVAAKDKRDTSYSNELLKGVHHPWVTKVDISNFKYDGHNETGTSFAAPRAGCFITSASDRYSIKVSDVLKYVRVATRLHPEHLLTAEMLDSLIEADKQWPLRHDKPDQTIDHDTPTSEQPYDKNNKSFQFDYYGVIPYNSDLFDDGIEGYITLSNGDRIHYKYVKDMDFYPTWSILVYMNGTDIRKKYKVAALESLDAEKGYVGKDNDYDSQIDVTISIGGFIDIGNSKLYLIVKNK